MRHPILALLAVVSLAGAPALAAGQTAPEGGQTRTEVSAQPPSEALAPGTAVDVTVEVTYTYQEGGAALAHGPTDVLLSARSTPDWADARFGTWMLEAPLEPNGAVATLEATLPVAVEDDAPPGAQGSLEVTAFASENDEMAPSQGSTSFPVEVADDGGGSGGGTASASGNGTASPSGIDSSPSSASAVPSGSTVAAVLAAGAAGAALGRRRSGSAL